MTVARNVRHDIPLRHISYLANESVLTPRDIHPIVYMVWISNVTKCTIKIVFIEMAPSENKELLCI